MLKRSDNAVYLRCAIAFALLCGAFVWGFRKLHLECFDLFGALRPSVSYHGYIAQNGIGGDRAEKSAAQKFCDQARGLHKSQILYVVGRPIYRGGTPPCWAGKGGSASLDIQTLKTDETWLYQYRSKAVELKFVKDRCVYAAPLSSALLSDFCRWREKEVSANLIGKPVSEIVAVQGQPLVAYGEPPVMNGCYKLMGGRYEIDLQTATNNPTHIVYDMGNDVWRELKIDCGICTEVAQLTSYQ